MDNSSILHLYLMNEISIATLYEQGRNKLAEEFSKVVLDDLEDTSINNMIKDVRENSNSLILSGNIPQFSSFENGTLQIIKHLRMCGDYGPTLTKIGIDFLGDGKKQGAYIKYGENHSKLARQYDMVYFIRDGSNRVYLTELGKLVEKLPVERQMNVLSKLSLKIPIVQYCLRNNIKSPNEVENLMKNFLSEKTALRRKSNVCKIIDIVNGGSK